MTQLWAAIGMRSEGGGDGVGGGVAGGGGTGSPPPRSHRREIQGSTCNQSAC